jgi:hypothetical protein
VTPDRRAQLVLVTAAVVAVALAPVVLAYLQLGYHPDAEAAEAFEAPAENAEHVLERAVHEASANATAVPWPGRTAVVTTVRGDLEPRIESLERSRVDDGTAIRVTYNRSAADAWAGEDCPGGAGRAFGPCEADRGVVVQERAGETTVLSVAFDVSVVEQRGRTDLTLVVRAIGD